MFVNRRPAPAHELFGSIWFCFCRGHPGGDRFLPVETEAGDKTGFEHIVVATVPVRNPSERTVPKVEAELVINSADHFIDPGGAGFDATFFCFESKTSGTESGDSGCVSVDAGDGRKSDAV